MPNLSDAEAVHLADRNYAEAFRLTAGGAVSGKVYEEPGFVAVITGPIAWLNVTVISEDLADPHAAISRAIDFYRKADASFVMRIRAGFAMKTQDAMRELNLVKADQVPGMVLNPVGDVPPMPGGLEIRDWDEASLEAHNEVIAASFGMPLDLANSLITRATVNSPLRGFIGYLDGKPVAASALVVSNGVAGVYNVATLPDYRKRGLGEAMTWHAVSEGLAGGCIIGSLQASEMGQPVYARMGFRNIAPYETYALRAAG